MSERPVEDEITEQARHFGRAMVALVSQHGRAVSWLEQRRIRKEISRALRQQRQAEYLARQQHKMWTEQAVDRYRAHAYAVAVRANNPYLDSDRRARDQVALRSHAVDLQARVLDTHRLKPVEQGIALDSIAAATEFPGLDRKGSLFAGAGRVKGVNALRYRATVARTREALPHQLTEVTEARRRINTPRSVETSRPDRARKAGPPQQADKPAAHAQPNSEADRLAKVEQQLKDIAADRDRMQSKVGMLQRGLDAVTADRDGMRSALAEAESRIETLTNRNQRLAAEIDEVRRDQPDLEQVRAERDQFKAQRDQAVAKLARQTPAPERFGSPERIATELRPTHSMPNPALNGHNGIERSR